MWKYYALLSALFAALTAVLSKAGVKNISGSTATAIRTLVIVIIAWCIVFFSGQVKELKSINKSNVLLLVLSGIATGLSWVFYFKALETGNVSKVAPLDKLSVVFTIILACLFLKEPLTPQVAIGGILITAGALVLLS